MRYSGPVKHSITIEGHQTSISLEPVFWDALKRAAREECLALNALVAHIDEQRIASFTAGQNPPTPSTNTTQATSANLASAIRSWLWERYCK